MNLAATRVGLDLETPRLLLRVPALTDFEDSFAMWRDPEVVRHISGKPSTREEAWSRLLRYVGHWHLIGCGFWIVREKGTGAFVGEVGVADFHREVEAVFDDGNVHEAGWALAAAAHGKGYATEAVRAALEWYDVVVGAPRVACMISPANAASVRVATKCGFAEFARGPYRGEPSLFLERHRGGSPA